MTDLETELRQHLIDKASVIDGLDLDAWPASAGVQRERRARPERYAGRWLLGAASVLLIVGLVALVAVRDRGPDDVSLDAPEATDGVEVPVTDPSAPPSAPLDRDPSSLSGEFADLLTRSQPFFPRVRRGTTCAEMVAASGHEPAEWIDGGPEVPHPPLVPMAYDVDGECVIIGWTKFEMGYGVRADGVLTDDGYLLYDDDGDVLAEFPLPEELPDELKP